MATDFPIQGILDHLVLRIVDVLPITAAGVTLMSRGNPPRYMAASDPSALRFEELQTELGEGPCVTASRTREVVAVPDLRSETRFPTFTARAIEEGLAAVFTFPLRHGEDPLGALDLYRSTPGPMEPTDLDAGQTLADVAAAYLYNAQARAELRASSDRSREQALHDGLTGLPNRLLLIERLDHAVLQARRTGTTVAVLFADLDRLKRVNDLYGHRVGDQLLVAVADRLSATMRAGDTLARMSGDEFVIVCEDLDAPAEIEAVAARIEAAFEAPFVLSGIHVAVTISVGIACTSTGHERSEELLQEADAAMYQAKRKGGGRHQVVDLREQHLADHRATLERDLHGAQDRGELRAVYQPIVETKAGAVTGLEALLRWAHPTEGMIAPTMLVPLAEQSWVINEIGVWILDRACRDRGRWTADDRPDDLTMAVNLSAVQLLEPGLVASVAEVLSATNTDPHLLTLEVTETVLVKDCEQTLRVLRELKELGVMLALDDFGVGYASLNYLKRFPIDIVKIDQSFIADLECDQASHAIVGSVIDLTHRLGMTVVAEGVETAAQRDALVALGCDQSQGNYFSRPMAADRLDDTLRGRDAGETCRPTLAPR
jgi:diguanylate cyclase (GGDEF)-like protein